MNAQQETLATRLRTRFDALSPTAVTVNLVHYDGLFDATDAKAACLHAKSESQWFGGVYGPCRRDPKECTWRQMCWDSADGDVLQRFHSLAIEAGECVGAWAKQFGVKQDSVTEKHPEHRWLYVLFDLAHLSPRDPRFPMPPESNYFANSDIFFLEQQERILRSDETEKLKRLKSQGYWSYLKDAVRASVYAIDVLTQPPPDLSADAEKVRSIAAALETWGFTDELTIMCGELLKQRTLQRAYTKAVYDNTDMPLRNALKAGLITIAEIGRRELERAETVNKLKRFADLLESQAMALAIDQLAIAPPKEDFVEVEWDVVLDSIGAILDLQQDAEEMAAEGKDTDDISFLLRSVVPESLLRLEIALNQGHTEMLKCDRSLRRVANEVYGFTNRLHWLITEAQPDESCRDDIVAILGYLNEYSCSIQQALGDSDGQKPNQLGEKHQPAEHQTTAIESLAEDVKKLKTQVRKPKTKREMIREQRNKFSRQKHAKGKTWNEIYDAYRAKYPDDKTASPDTLRLSLARDPANRQ